MHPRIVMVLEAGSEGNGRHVGKTIARSNVKLNGQTQTDRQE